MNSKNRIRILDWSLRDEEGRQWHREPGWLGRNETIRAISQADKVVVHVEADRLARPPFANEVVELCEKLTTKGGSGEVMASIYRSESKILILLSIVDS